jgi:1,2-diacylglycerol 3-beta-galactosyltransferase
MRKLHFVYFDAGGGHRAAATALKLAIEQQNRSWDVQLVNLQELLDELDIFRKITGLRMQDIYNSILRRGWTLGSPQLVPIMHAVIRLYHPQQVRMLKRFWGVSQPDLVVSLVPNFNRAMRDALPDTPFVTILTDFADYPPHFWIEQQEQYLICGTGKAVAQAESLGHPRDRIFRVSGMILHPRFYENIEVDPASERRRLGLDPATPTALVMFGGYGSKAMLNIARRLTQSGLELQLILICGHNQSLAKSLSMLETRMPLFVEGFTKEIPYYMHLSDFFIGKPGPGSISEALQMGLPVLVEKNAWTLPQERYNADWVQENDVGIVVDSFNKVNDAAAVMLTPDRLSRMKTNVRQLHNRAVFEIPAILERLFRI